MSVRSCRHVLDVASGFSALCGLAALSWCARYTYAFPTDAYHDRLRCQLHENAEHVVCERLRFEHVDSILAAVADTALQLGGMRFHALVARVSRREGSMSVEQALHLACTVLALPAVMMVVSDDGAVSTDKLTLPGAGAWQAVEHKRHDLFSVFLLPAKPPSICER